MKSEPIPVLRMTFVDDRQGGPGLSVSSSCVSMLENVQKKHRIWYVPWMDSFWVEEYDKSGSTPVLKDGGYIPRERVMSWKPATPPSLGIVEDPAKDRLRK